MTDDLSHISPVWGRLSDLVIERGEGSWVFTTTGEQYLDFTSGIGVTNTGHCHPGVVKAIQDQAARMIHAQVNCYFHTPLVRLSQALNAATPDHFDAFFFSNSGAEAVEGAVKLARHATGRPNLIVFQGGFHGRTHLTMAMTTAKTVYRVRYQPLPGGIFVAPFPFAYRYGMKESEAVAWALRELDMILHTQTDPAETAALIIEPVLGEGGYVPAPVAFLHGLREVCNKYGMLLIVDEIQSGMGRTGRFFAHEHADVRADIMVVAKGLASGFPISCVASGRTLMDKWTVGTHGGTYGGNPIGCAAAEATLRVMQEEGLIENAATRGRQLIEGLKKLQRKYPAIGDVRGLGLMVGTEFVRPEGREPDADLTKKVVTHAQKTGKLLLLTCGMYGNVIRWIPPLVVTEAQIEQALETFEAALLASG